jgi:hypothetical protein
MRGLHLASITTPDELAFVNTIQAVKANNTWIGGSDSKNEGEWLWTSGEDWLIAPCSDKFPSCDSTIEICCDSSIDLWGLKEPNNDGPGEDSENCASINDSDNGALDGKFNDLPCGQKRHFLCERKLPLPPELP